MDIKIYLLRKFTDKAFIMHFFVLIPNLKVYQKQHLHIINLEKQFELRQWLKITVFVYLFILISHLFFIISYVENIKVIFGIY